MKYELYQLINIDTLELFMDNLYRITESPASLIDVDGNILISNKERTLSDSYDCLVSKITGEAYKQVFKRLTEGTDYCMFEYENNSVLIAVPIFVKDYHLATLILGEIFLEESYIRHFSIIDEQYGIKDEDQIKVIDIISSSFEDRIKNIIYIILEFKKMISLTATRHAIQLETQEKLNLSKKRFNLIVEGSNDVIWEWNINTGKSFISEKWQALTGFDLPSNYNLFDELAKVVHTEDLRKVNLALKNHIDGKTEFLECEYRINTKAGAYKWILQKGKILKNTEENHAIMAGSITDITHKKIYEEEINYLAYYDIVTNLPNRIFFEKKLNEEVNKLKLENLKMAFFFIDVDDFKKINDIYGHEVGDKFLLSIADELKNTIEKDEILCRFGGDEFLLAVLQYEDIDEIISKAEKLINISSKMVKVGDKRFYPSFSIGVSLYDEKCENIGDMIKYSDIAMYKAKKSGKNRYAIFNEVLHEEFIKRRQLELDLNKALDNNELILYYQPQIDIAGRKVYGIEALLRWNHPKFGLLTPGSFIDMMEKSDKINEIGKFVLNEACIASKNLSTLGYDNLLVSINLCEKQLLDSSFVAYVEELFERLNINTRNICFEITERMLLSENKVILDTLDRLRNMGIEIFIDDFGIKYSSLNYLNRFNVSGLKIDKSFIDKIGYSKKDFIITKNIVKLAQDLNIHVIAEGVESEEQINCLKNIKCCNIQGFLFSKPISYESLINYVNRFNYKSKSI